AWCPSAFSRSLHDESPIRTHEPDLGKTRVAVGKNLGRRSQTGTPGKGSGGNRPARRLRAPTPLRRAENRGKGTAPELRGIHRPRRTRLGAVGESRNPAPPHRKRGDL